MTKRERALDEAVEAAIEMHANTGAIRLAALEAIETYNRVMSEPEPDEPPEGKLRVRVCVAVSEDRSWTSAGHHDWDEETTRAEALYADEDAQPHWIEADIPEWQPPAEETVQGREG